jgi:hypothetical protein
MRVLVSENSSFRVQLHHESTLTSQCQNFQVVATNGVRVEAGFEIKISRKLVPASRVSRASGPPVVKRMNRTAAIGRRARPR